MDREKLKNLVEKGNYDKSKLLVWVNSLPKQGKIKPNSFKVGDVFMHPVFSHPYILLKKKKDYYVCTMLTSEENCEEILEQCESRFFSDSYITNILFTVKEPIGGFMSVYNNQKQLKQVYTTLKSII